MKILILHKINYPEVRNTILEHLFSFKKYATKVQFHYFNVKSCVPRYLSKIKYDGVIIHYTFLAQRFFLDYDEWKNFISGIKKLKGYKVAMPQDEYVNTDKLCHLFKEHDVHTVFTCFSQEKDYLKAYPPKETGIKHHIPVLTGYVDEEAVKKLEPLCKPYAERSIDIGYRAREVPFVLGKHGQLKTLIAEAFLKKLKNTKFTYDISTTGDTKNAFFGKEWYLFLLRCKAFLGCESGASLLDKTGEISKKVTKYTNQHPDTPFEKVERAFFPGEDHNISLYALGPRHFEAIITKTCQVLVEGCYNGVLEANKHYISVKKDFSNVRGVLEKLKDEEYCQKMIDTAYDDIVRSGKYTYRTFVRKVINHIKEQKTTTSHQRIAFPLVGGYLKTRNALYSIFIKLIYFCIIKPIKKTNILNAMKRNHTIDSFMKKLIRNI